MKQSFKRRNTNRKINIGSANLDILDQDEDSDEVMRVDTFDHNMTPNTGLGMQALINTKEAIGHHPRQADL